MARLATVLVALAAACSANRGRAPAATSPAPARDAPGCEPAAEGALVAVVQRHDTPRPSLAWAPDGAAFFSVSDDVVLWDGATGARRGVVAPPERDERWELVVPTRDGLVMQSLHTLAAIDLRTGVARTLRTFDPDASAVVSPDGARVAYRADDGVHLAAADRSAHDDVLVDAHATAMAWSARGTALVTSVDGDDQVTWTVYDAATRAVRFVRREPARGQRPYARAAWSPDDARVAFTQSDAHVAVCDGRTGAAVATIDAAPGGESVWVDAIRLGPGGRRLFVRRSPEASLIDVDAPEHRVALGAIDDVAFTPDGGRIVTVGKRGGAILDAATGATLATIAQGVTSVAVRPDGRAIAASAPLDDEIDRVDLIDPATGASLAGPGAKLDETSVELLAWSPRPERLAVWRSDAPPEVWDVAAGVPEPPPVDFDQAAIDPERAAFSTDGRWVALGKGDQVTVLDARTWRRAQGFAPIATHAPVFAWSPDGARLATATDTALEVRRVADGAVVGSVPLPSAPTAVAWSSPSNRLAVAVEDAVVVVDGATLEVRTSLPFRATSLGFGPQGLALALGVSGVVGTVVIADATSGRAFASFDAGRRAGLADASFSADGGYVAAVVNDETLALWDVERRRRIGLPFTAPLADQDAFAWAPRGNALALFRNGALHVCRMGEHMACVELSTVVRDGARAGLVVGAGTFSGDDRAQGAILLRRGPLLGGALVDPRAVPAARRRHLLSDLLAGCPFSATP